MGDEGDNGDDLLNSLIPKCGDVGGPIVGLSCNPDSQPPNKQFSTGSDTGVTPLSGDGTGDT